ncbi:MAG TPA: hypothetical protein VKZ18_23075 [Polyangia bacterium]|nr:hypothetical protein [Polyangia bacterium]
MRAARALVLGWVASTALAARAAAAAPAATPGPAAPPEQRASTTIAMHPARASLKLGVDKEVEVTIDLSGPDAERFVPLRVLTTVGTLEPPRALGPGHFSVLYRPPEDRFPQVALLLTELGSGAARLHCATRIVLEGATVYPFRTGAGASVTMRVADRQFGPVIADRQGHVEIPIEVPPGVHKAAARAVDHTGASRETEVDLQLPPFPRILVLAPSSVEVGSFTEITVAALDENGAPAAPAKLSLVTSGGLAHPLGGPPGEARFLFEAPARVGAGAVAVAAVAAGTPPARSDLKVSLRPGPPHKLAVTAASPALIVGETRPVTVTIAARDRFANPVSAAEVFVRVDGRPTSAAVSAEGLATISVTPPRRYDGRESVLVDATLGNVVGAQSLRVTGGPPARLALQVASPRVVGDGRHGTLLRVQAVDANGTPTAVSGLSWDTPEGRIREVRVPREGEYVAEYLPDRTRDPHRQTVAVMASQTLRADATLEVTPPPVRLVAGARVGLFSNFGETVGPAAFVEGLAPVRVPHLRLWTGFAAGYLRGDVTGGGVNMNGTARLETNQFPVLGVVRGGISLGSELGLALEADAGWSWGWVRVTANPGTPQVDSASVNAPALGGGAQLTYLLKPGFLAVGLRYLWIDLGRTSAGDEIAGNSAGLVADLGYNMTF